MVRKIRAKLVLSLRAEGLSDRAIAAAQSMSCKSVLEVFAAADRANVRWNDIADQSGAEVYALLFPGRGEHQSVYAQPDWTAVHRELARVGVTLKLLHAEYLDRCQTAFDPAMSCSIPADVPPLERVSLANMVTPIRPSESSSRISANFCEPAHHADVSLDAPIVVKRQF